MSRKPTAPASTICGRFQGAELGFGPDNRGDGLLHDRFQRRRQPVVAVIAVLAAVHGRGGPRHRSDDGEHGSLNRFAQRRPAADLGPLQGRGQQRSGQPGGSPQWFGQGRQENGQQGAEFPRASSMAA